MLNVFDAKFFSRLLHTHFEHCSIFKQVVTGKKITTWRFFLCMLTVKTDFDKTLQVMLTVEITR